MLVPTVARFGVVPLFQISSCRSRTKSFGQRQQRQGLGLRLIFSAPHTSLRECAVQSDLTENASFDATLDLPEEQQSTLESVPETNDIPNPPPTEPVVDDTLTELVADETKEQISPNEVRNQPWLSQGAAVAIRIQKIRHLGATVLIVGMRPQKAFLPFCAAPVFLLDETASTDIRVPEVRFERGIVRKAIVHTAARRVDKNGIRNLVSAELYDKDILWRRLFQLREFTVEGGEVISSPIIERKKGGLLLNVIGFPAFLPCSFFTTAAEKAFYCSAEEFKTKYQNKTIDICVKDVEPGRSRVVVNALTAEKAKLVHKLAIGSLVTGGIRNMTAYGVFVSLDGLNTVGLLHIRNISRRVVTFPEEVFQLGEQLSAIVIDISPDFSRVSLSTAEMEEVRGEILWNKERVMNNAEFMARRFQSELDEARKLQNAQKDQDE